MKPQDKDPWGAANRARYRTLVNRPNVRGIFCGHFHRDDLHWVGNIPLFSAPSIAGYWGRQASFRVYHWQDGRLGYITVYVQ
jgi:UDP-2,3-diacylglucosamine pyrophosphatase LpxH